MLVIYFHLDSFSARIIHFFLWVNFVLTLGSLDLSRVILFRDAASPAGDDVTESVELV